MCLVNCQGRTNSKNLRSYRPYGIGWKCGHCAECVREKRNEWLLRSYFESMNTIEKGGYILFETLTYDDLHIPTISRFFPQIEDDFTCFSYDDVRKFTNNLWTAINRYPHLEDYDVKQNVKFFLVSEYGHENIYIDDNGRTRKGTMRPHYHVLFYVKDRRLHPGTLVRLIYHLWRRGETDNHRNGMSYCMAKNVIGRGYTKDKVKNIIAVSNYVSKYITKQADYMEKVEERIDKTVCSLINDGIVLEYKKVVEYFRYLHNYFDDKMKNGDTDFSDYVSDDLRFPLEFVNSFREKRKEVVSYISPFHRQSRGFGECALRNENVYSEILDKFQITIPDTKFVKKTYNVPLYYMRKLFYRTVIDDEGMYHWVLNELGKEKYPQIMEKKVEYNVRRYDTWYRNIKDTDTKELVNSVLDGRTFKDLAEYVVYYRGRIFDRDVEFVDDETGEITMLPTKEQIVNFDINYSPLEDTGVYNNGYNIIHKVDLRYIGADDQDYEFENMFDDFMSSLYGDNWFDETMDESYKAFECSRVINEKTDYKFRYFDQLLDMFALSYRHSAVGKQAYFDLVENLARKIKG